MASDWGAVIGATSPGLSQDLCHLLSTLSTLAAAAAAAKSLQSCPTLCDPIDGSLPGFPIPWILQAKTLEWVAISFSKCMKVKRESEVAQSCPTLATPWTAAYQAPPSMGFVALFLDCLFCSIDLCAWFYVNTMLF